MSMLPRNAGDHLRRVTGNPKSVRVLVVDDNPDLRAFICTALERAGFETAVAGDGECALALQNRQPADVLITDIYMPELDGLELIQQFKARFPRTQIVAMSGGGTVAHADFLHVAAEIGAEAVLRKPFATETLVKTVQGLAAR